MGCKVKNIQPKEVTIGKEYKKEDNKNDIIYEFNKQCKDIYNKIIQNENNRDN